MRGITLKKKSIFFLIIFYPDLIKPFTLKTTLEKNKIALNCCHKMLCLQKYMYGNWQVGLDHEVEYVLPDDFLQTTEKGGIGFYVEEDTLLVVIPGIISLVPLIQGLLEALNLDLYHSLQLFGGKFIKKFDQHILDKIRNLLIQNPQVTRIRLTGQSYGGGVTATLAYILTKLINYHLNGGQEKFCDELYSESISRSILQGPTQNLPLVRKLKLDPNTDKNKAILAIKKLDKKIFSRIFLDSIYIFGSPAFFPSCFISEYDKLYLKKFPSRFYQWITRNSEKILLSNVTYNYYFENDPIARCFSERGLFGKIMQPFLSFPGREAPGKMIILESDSISAKHSYSDYANYFQANLGKPLSMYERKNTPFPLLTISSGACAAHMMYRLEFINFFQLVLLILFWYIFLFVLFIVIFYPIYFLYKCFGS